MNLFELMEAEQQKQELQQIIDCNKVSEKFGLALTHEDVNALMVCRKETLRETRRLEMDGGILPEIIYAFCDSQYVNKQNYVETLSELQEIFYYYKNESMDQLTDDELVYFMRTQFEETCFGDLEYLKGTCLERFSAAVRAGYQCRMQRDSVDEYSLADEGNEYLKMSEETGWEFELFKLKMEEMD